MPDDRPGLRDESLVEVATFLVRRWSGRDGMTVEVSEGADTRTRLSENKTVLAPLGKRIGGGLDRYRQFRTSLWYEAMRARFCKKILSNDHAFGFILNAMETRRVEELGRRIWRGMDDEILFNYAYMLASRPQLHAVYGKARIVEAFYQYFMFGAVKGEIPQGHLERVRRAAAVAGDAVRAATARRAGEGGRGGGTGGDSNASDDDDPARGTAVLEGRVSEIIRILDIDSLLTIPVSLPFMRAGMAVSREDLRRFLKVVSGSRREDGLVPSADPDGILRGDDMRDEYRLLLEEDARARNKGLAPSEAAVGTRVPSTQNVDAAAIHDAALINGLKTKFREWKSGLREQHVRSGDEFDDEAYVEGHDEPFIADIKRSIRTRIVILLDHSSSISSVAVEYKKATLALCEVLAYLRVGFAVYAFSTQDRSVVCWSVKPADTRWGSVTAKRLARIVANGSTPLAEVYDKMLPVLQSGRPDILLTLTDGEPSDPDGVRGMARSIARLGIRMVAMGLGPNTVRATAIADNLRRLGYERTVAVSRLNDIPGKVLRILE